jgi:hypothetical protein
VHDLTFAAVRTIESENDPPASPHETLDIPPDPALSSRDTTPTTTDSELLVAARGDRRSAGTSDSFKDWHLAVIIGIGALAILAVMVHDMRRVRSGSDTTQPGS